LSAEACLLFGESLRIRQEIGDPRGVAICFKRLGDVAAALHKQEQAKGYYRESLALC
jgi:Tetratricopeptide repeat